MPFGPNQPLKRKLQPSNLLSRECIVTSYTITGADVCGHKIDFIPDCSVVRIVMHPNQACFKFLIFRILLMCPASHLYDSTTSSSASPPSHSQSSSYPSVAMKLCLQITNYRYSRRQTKVRVADQDLHQIWIHCNSVLMISSSVLTTYYV